MTLEDKEYLYKFLVDILPKFKFKRLNPQKSNSVKWVSEYKRFNNKTYLLELVFTNRILTEITEVFIPEGRGLVQDTQYILDRTSKNDVLNLVNKYS